MLRKYADNLHFNASVRIIGAMISHLSEILDGLNDLSVLDKT